VPLPLSLGVVAVLAAGSLGIALAMTSRGYNLRT